MARCSESGPAGAGSAVLVFCGGLSRCEADAAPPNDGSSRAQPGVASFVGGQLSSSSAWSLESRAASERIAALLDKPKSLKKVHTRCISCQHTVDLREAASRTARHDSKPDPKPDPKPFLRVPPWVPGVVAKPSDVVQRRLPCHLRSWAVPTANVRSVSVPKESDHCRSRQMHLTSARSAQSESCADSFAFSQACESSTDSLVSSTVESVSPGGVPCLVRSISSPSSPSSASSTEMAPAWASFACRRLALPLDALPPLPARTFQAPASPAAARRLEAATEMAERAAAIGGERRGAAARSRSDRERPCYLAMESTPAITRAVEGGFVMKTHLPTPGLTLSQEREPSMLEESFNETFEAMRRRLLSARADARLRAWMRSRDRAPGRAGKPRGARDQFAALVR